jgi:hypothetical protein
MRIMLSDEDVEIIAATDLDHAVLEARQYLIDHPSCDFVNFTSLAGTHFMTVVRDLETGHATLMINLD